MLVSGGKDSIYALYQLVELGLTPLVFTLDNGFISEGAKVNIQRAVDDLGLELVMGSTPAMNEIFAESLEVFSNVCQGCFKTVYNLGMNLAPPPGPPLRRHRPVTWSDLRDQARRSVSHRRHGTGRCRQSDRRGSQGLPPGRRRGTPLPGHDDVRR